MRTFHGVTPAHWFNVVAIAQGFGFPIMNTMGTGEAFGVRIQWTYWQTEQELQIKIIDPGLLGTPEAALDWLQQNVVDPAMQAAPTPSR